MSGKRKPPPPSDEAKVQFFRVTTNDEPAEREQEAAE
jgi:hypothetical protein